MIGRLVAFALLCGCAAGSGTSFFEQDVGSLAHVKLDQNGASITQTSGVTWSLTKTGVVDPTTKTVTWTITATHTSTVAKHLVIQGHLRVRNDGQAGATLGNAVIALATQNGGGDGDGDDDDWTTRTADVADATHGDAATSVNIADGSVTTVSETAASGPLAFSDAHTHAPFSLVPEATLAPHHKLDLDFTADFDNNVLQLPAGAKVRIYAVLTFGDAGGGHTESHVDINGNGVIDPDELSVRSVSSKLKLVVPPEVSAATPTLSDSITDLTTTGTVTASNPQFTLGATSGTASATYDGGSAGGTLGNCAHLTTPDLTVDLQACDVETIPAHCTPGAPGCGWSDGDMVTYTQADWGGDPSTSAAAALLAADYNTVFAPTSGVVEVGIPGSAGFSMQFLDALAVLTYLPASGAGGPLVADLLNPTSTPAGSFGGDALALRLDIAFSDAAALGGTSGLRFGDLTLCNLTTLPALDNMRVRDFEALVDNLLGGGSGVYTISDVQGLLTALNGAFRAGTVSSFAQQDLVNGTCP